MWECAQVFRTFEQTATTSKFKAGLLCYGGQESMRPAETTPAVDFVKFLPHSFQDISFTMLETSAMPYCFPSTSWVYIRPP